ncbi:hypothetical protein Tco_0065207 [Tanacetum coccineum]
MLARLPFSSDGGRDSGEERQRVKSRGVGWKREEERRCRMESVGEFEVERKIRDAVEGCEEKCGYGHGR